MHGQNFARLGKVGNALAMLVMHKFYSCGKQFRFVPYYQSVVGQVVGKHAATHKRSEPGAIHHAVRSRKLQLGQNLAQTALSVWRQPGTRGKFGHCSQLVGRQSLCFVQRINYKFVHGLCAAVLGHGNDAFGFVIPEVHAVTLAKRQGNLQYIAAHGKFALGGNTVHATETAGDKIAKQHFGVVANALDHAETVGLELVSRRQKLHQRVDACNAHPKAVQQSVQYGIAIVHHVFA